MSKKTEKSVMVKSLLSVVLVVVALGATGFFLTTFRASEPPVPAPKHAKKIRNQKDNADKAKKEEKKEKKDKEQVKKANPPEKTKGSTPESKETVASAAKSKHQAKNKKKHIKKTPRRNRRPKRNNKKPITSRQSSDAATRAIMVTGDADDRYDVQFASDAALARMVKRVQVEAYACSPGGTLYFVPVDDQYSEPAPVSDRCSQDVIKKLNLRELEYATDGLTTALNVTNVSGWSWYLAFSPTLSYRVDEMLGKADFSRPGPRPVVLIHGDGSVTVELPAPRISRSNP